MRVLLLLAFAVVPSIALAFGVEESFLVGISPRGQVTTIGVQWNWNGEAPVPYESSKDPVFRYCYKTDDGVFQCGASRSGTPTVIFKSGNYQPNNGDPTKGTGVRYKEAMTYLKKAMAYVKRKKIQAEFDGGYYVCEKGCANDRPLFLFWFLQSSGCC